MKVLFLSAWYPTRYDAMEGLFVRKHAQAVARQGVEVHVLFVRPASDVIHPEFVCEIVEGVHENIMFCPVPKSSFDEVMNLRRAWCCWHSHYNVLPDITHLNVITKNGWLARYLKARYRIPYVITEHWTGYLSENGDFKGLGRKLSSQWIAAGAELIMPVSDMLADAMRRHGIKGRYKVVNNVVDDFFYGKSPVSPHEKFRFLHVSCFLNRAKNNIGIVEATAALARSRTDFEVVMLGTGQDFDMTVTAADRYGLRASGVMTFAGEVTPGQVKQYMDSSDTLLMFSNFETYLVVLAESLACGLPMICTRTGIAEAVIDARRGCLVEVGDVDGLVAQMNYMIDHIAEFDRDIIRRGSEEFSYDVVGREILSVYNGCLGQ